MTERRISDDALMALADNELPETEANELRAALRNDEDAATRFAMFVETRMLLADPARHDEEVSDALRAAVVRADAQYSAQDRITTNGRDRALPGRPSHDRGPRRAVGSGANARRWQMPMAAALLLSLGGLSGYLIAQQQRSADNSLQTALMTIPGNERALSDALDTGISGSETVLTGGQGEKVRIVVLSTHRLADGTFCREFEIARAQESLIGASCRRNNGWRTEVAVLRDSGKGRVVPASGAAVVDDHLNALGSEGALSPEDERAAMAHNWSLR